MFLTFFAELTDDNLEDGIQEYKNFLVTLATQQSRLSVRQ